MSDQFKPDGWPIVTPRIVVNDAKGLAEFIKDVFKAGGEYSDERPAILTIGDSMIMISESGIRHTSPAFLYVYVADADAAYQRAIDLGATSMEEPLDTPYGDRRAMIEDRWGNTWQIATHKGS